MRDARCPATAERRLWRFTPIWALLFTASALAAQVADDVLMRGFRSTADYMLEVDGTVDPKAEIYLSQRIPAFLCMSERLASPVLVVPRGQQVQSVHIMKVAKQSDGSIDLLPDALLARLGNFEVVGEEIRFTAERRSVALKEKPPLLGLHDLAAMQRYSAEYVQLADSYTPSAEAIAALRRQSTPVKVRVYFGSWCPFCQRYVPRLMRVARDLAGGKIEFDFYGLPRAITSDPVSAQMQISSVPTGVVFVGGKEAGRILSDQWRTPEVAINEILAR